MQPAHSSRVCHHVAILFKPTHPVLHTNHPVQQATCSGPASDNEHFTCYSALWLTGHVHISGSCVNFTALLIIMPSHISWKQRLRGSMTYPTSKCQNQTWKPGGPQKFPLRDCFCCKWTHSSYPTAYAMHTGEKSLGSHVEKQAVIGTLTWRRESQQGRNSEHKVSKSAAEHLTHIYRLDFHHSWTC